MLTNLRGELTLDSDQQFRLKEGRFVHTVAAALDVGSEKVKKKLFYLMYP